MTEGGFSYGYDNNGNMLTKSGNSENYTLSYNPLNQLVRAEMTTSAGSSSVDYLYDHDGIRVGKTLNGTNVINYIVDKNRAYAQVLEEQDDVGDLLARYVYGDNLLSQHRAGTQSYYHYDGLGSTRALSDATGIVTDTYRYDAYGMFLDKTGTTSNSYLYRGEQYDADLSLYYLRARYYQTGIGRFLTTDPVEGFPTGPISQHRYMYGNSDPINRIDPSGELNTLDMSVTGAIISNIASMTIGQLGFMDWFYERFEPLFPDAGLIGVSLSGYLQFFAPSAVPSKELALFLSTCVASGIPVPDPSEVIRGGGSGGIDFLFSLGSAEIAVFLYYGGLFEGANSTTSSKKWDFRMTFYQGWVWNLWNAKNYTGPFIGISIGGEVSGRSLFCDATDGLKGPYGMTVPFLSWSARKMNTQSSLGASLMFWDKHYLSFPFEDPRMVGLALMTAQAGIMFLSAMREDVVSLISSSISFGFTGWIANAKAYWNEKKSPYTIQQRQKMDRPSDFQSGPGKWFF